MNNTANIKYQLGLDNLIKDNPHEAKLNFKIAADLGHIEARFELGCIYHNQEKFDLALNEFLVAAHQGDVKSQQNVGSMYYGGKGVEQNFEEAFKWYSKSAKQGDVNSQYALAVMYNKGEGVKLNNGASLHWLIKAANQGHKLATKNLNKLKEDLECRKH
ncbi:MAG: sel1 repeat family protein [Mesoflavibacter sp.]|nr:sel1 repeat family protein [Mesoflavibacter sp.]